MFHTFVCETGSHPFYLEEKDIAAYKKFGFEPLPICFRHQHQWRMSFRNDRFLHRRKCDLTGEMTVSMYPQNAPYKIYERVAWFSDKWNPLDYGRDFDFNRPFFEQYADLQREVPRMALVNVGSINSDFCNSCVYNKNCYLIFGGDRNEESYYGILPMFCKNCVDCDWTTYCELCYFSSYCERCYRCRFAFYSKGCSDCAFIEDCIGCDDCMLCFNLRNKHYHIENQSYSKEEYFKKKAELLNGSFKQQQKLWKQFLELRKNRIVKYGHILNSENVSGELIFNSKNCHNCYECVGSEDCREIIMILDAKDCFNADYLGKGTVLNFNTISTDGAYRAWFSYFIIDSSDIEYSEAVINSKHCFGCIGLRHKEYCIFNKQYPREEFIELRSRIIEHMKHTGEWGRYFPKGLSTFPYNNSCAVIYYPLSKEEAQKQGFKWSDIEFASQKQTYRIPDNINDVPDAITKEILQCETTRRNYRIIPQELGFYRQQAIPVPRLQHDQRYQERLLLRNPWNLFERTCKNCGAPVKTTYAPDRLEAVYCEKCYLELIY